MMSGITIEKNVTPIKLDTLAIDRWPIWSKEVSTFDWLYEQNETCYILEGEAIITIRHEANDKSGSRESVTITEGDLVSFSQGLSCQWRITSPIKKHYNLK
ncbi:MAG: cupin domain-containing protein [Thiohalomonadales bacterium]